MHRHRASLGLVTLTASVLLSACSVAGGPLVHRMDVAVTAETRTITEGKLTARLLGYDPNIADKPADTLDVQELTLQHRQGARTTEEMTLSAEVPEGFETYVSVEGYERQNGAWKRILWDGLEGTGMPTQVEMQLLPEETPEGQRLEESLIDWRVLKETNGGDYQYDVLFGSWTGYTTTTTLEVRDDEVVLRRYVARDIEGEVTERWTETGPELGSHESGAPLQIVEDLYATCRYEVLTQDRDENDIYLEFGRDGVLDYCQYVPKNCADDCARGVSIDELRFLGEPEVFAISTDESAYVAHCTDDGLLSCTFTLEATYHNRTDAPVYLYRCYPDSEYPIYGVSTLVRGKGSEYNPVWACVGYNRHIRVDPGETRTDVLEVRGPNSFDGVTGEPFGVVEGAFQLRYDAHPCGGEGDCDSLPEVQRLSAPFKVTVRGQGTEDMRLAWRTQQMR